jgi:hypothetical protein
LSSGKASTAHTADVGLVDADLYLQFGEVLGDLEQDGRRQAGGDRLAGLDLAIGDHAADRGDDVGPAEINIGGVQGGAGRGDAGPGGGDGCLGRLPGGEIGVEGRLGGDALVVERLGAVVVGAGDVGLGLKLVHLGLALGDLGLTLLGAADIGLRVEHGHDLAGLHIVVEVDQHPGDLAADLRADLDGDKSLERAAGRDRLGDVAVGHLFGPVGILRRLGLEEHVATAAQHHGRSDAPGDREPGELGLLARGGAQAHGLT